MARGEKERLAEAARVEKFAQQHRREPRLSSARGERQHHARRFSRVDLPDELLARRANRRVLIVTQRAAPMRVWRGEQRQRGRRGREAARREIPRHEFLGPGKFAHRSRLGSRARRVVVFDELVPVGRKDKRHMMQLPDAVALALLQAVLRRFPLVLRLQDRERNASRAFREWTAKQIIRAPRRSPLPLPINDVDLPRRLFDEDVSAPPSASVDQHGINQLKTSLGFIPQGRHGVGDALLVEWRHGCVKLRAALLAFAPNLCLSFASSLRRFPTTFL